jgi:DNA repair exonuclease SbcCD ATPase subunit/DNA repair exonuclease SbcCD nuclease subunit
MKAFHISDIHFRGLTRHDEYRKCFNRLFDVARKEKPDVFFIGGDIVHSKTQGITPELIDILTWCFETMAQIAPVHMILGNHDGLMHNKSRQDAISPIINAIGNDRIKLYKQSGVYPAGVPGVNWCVFSCFDEDGWDDVKPVQGDINIACFHGSVRGSSTDSDWKVNGEVTADFFDGFDYVFLGDIHKRQNVAGDGVIAYPGSFIQQDYGEDVIKGCLFWDIKTKTSYDSKFIHIVNDSPFVTIGYRGNIDETFTMIDDMPTGARVRIASDIPVPPTTLHLIETRLQATKTPKEIVYKIADIDAGKSISRDGSAVVTDLRQPKVIKELIRDYYADASLPVDKLTRIDEIVDRYMKSLDLASDEDRNYNWSLDKLTFKNTFAFRNDNVIDFSKSSGITGIFGKNRAGKSSIIGSLVYCLFNTSDRGSLKNLHIINDKENTCEAEADITVKGDKYKITRRTKKTSNKKGDINVNTSLAISKLDTDLQLSDVSDEQRRETEKVLRQLIGTADDFFMTSLAAQGNLNKFFDEKSTARKQIIGKFLNLDIFDALYERSREDLVPLRSSFKGRRDKQQIDAKIEDATRSLHGEKSKFEELSAEYDSLTKKITGLRDIINGDSSGEAALKLRELEKKESAIESKLDEASTALSLACVARDKHQSRLDKFKKVRDAFSIDDLRQTLNQQRDLETRLESANRELQQHIKAFARLNEDVGILSTVPCGDEFPKCPFIKKAFESKSKVAQEKEEIDQQKLLIGNMLDALSNYVTQDVAGKISKYEQMLVEERNLQIEVSKLDLKIDHNEKIVSEQSHNKKEAYREIERLRAVVSDSTALCGVYDTIKEIEAKIEKVRKDQLTNAKNIGSFESSIETLAAEKETLEKDLVDLEIYELFNVAMSKKGLPSRLISKLLPLVNAEIQNILLGVCNFTVELEVDDDSNSLEVYINYGDKRRIIELGSGMEKMISAIATRVALINMSSLPKSNVLIIDEGFGALDDANLEACARLLKSLKKYFDQILIISHVDAIKDAVDNFVEINWIDGGANVRYE